VEDEERGGREGSRTCSFKLKGTSPALESTVGVMVSDEETEAAAGCRGGWVEWMEAGAVLGPVSN